MKLSDYLPNNQKATALAQGRVEQRLLHRTREKMKRENITWDEFLTAACKAYLEEPVPSKQEVL